MALTRRTCLAWGVVWAAPLGLTACFGSGPAAVVQGFYGAVAEGNVDKAMTFLALEQVSANEMMMVKGKLQVALGISKQKIDANGGLAGVQLLEETEQGEGRLRVKVEVKFKNGKTETDYMNLVKEKDGWKIKL
jgi:hypothetical protein